MLPSNPSVLTAMLCVAAYLVGSIPFGLLLTRATKGVDLREIGSGNIGATNAARVGGRSMGVVVLLLDALKGAVPTWIGLEVLGIGPAVAAAAAAFLGHLFPIYLGFRGGKGVATALGIFVVLSPWSALAALVVYGTVLARTHVSALGSLAATFTTLVLVLVLRASPPILVLCAAMTAVIFLRHGSNLAQFLPWLRPPSGPAGGSAPPAA
jgi:acyl phosphate:glycerol-3-phosphate acyltransferase